MKTSDFSYDLPERLIAQTPAEPRDSARMMVIDPVTQTWSHHIFREFPEYLFPGDALVINDTRVIPARLLGVKEDTGVPCEVLLLRRLDLTRWETLVRPGRRLRPGARVSFGEGRLLAEIGQPTPAGGRIIQFIYEGVFEQLLEELGEMPLPPYIHTQLKDPLQYQTVYAREDGSAAAPTAGLHFTRGTLEAIRAKGVDIVPVLLHVGLGTFRPVKDENVEDHVMHEEFCRITSDAADRLNAVRRRGGRIVSAGTTALRALESAADENGVIRPFEGMTGIFITPGYRYRAVDALMTNFHLPQSTLLMLVSAMMGTEFTLRVYRDAVEREYRFFSFGDCMLITRRKEPEQRRELCV